VTTPFADRFAEAETTTIAVDGETLHSLVEIPVHGPASFVVVRVAARSDRPQGLVIDSGDVDLVVETVQTPRITLWSDTSPDSVTVAVDEQGPVTLKVWNSWRRGSVEHAWVGWAAMKLEEREGTTTLSCRDGHGDGDFHDLVVELSPIADQDSGLFTTALH
jgi:hypothetical protein